MNPSGTKSVTLDYFDYIYFPKNILVIVRAIYICYILFFRLLISAIYVLYMASYQEKKDIFCTKNFLCFLLNATTGNRGVDLCFHNHLEGIL